MTKLPRNNPDTMAYIEHSVFQWLIYIIEMHLLLFYMSSCVDMPDVRLIEVDNRPPVIDKSSISPNSAIVKVDSSCKKDFSFSTTTELDIDDILYVRWYVDYDTIKNYQKSSLIPPVDKGITRGGDNFSLDLRNSILPSKSRGSLHTIEVMVADRPFVLDSTVAPPFKAIEEGGNYDYISWTVIQLDDCY